MMWEYTYKVLEDYAQTLRNLYQDKLITDDKIATGRLLNSIEYVVEKNDMQIEVSLRIEDYWKYIEDGREAGRFPPIDKIREWIRVKPILPRPFNGKLPTEDQLTFLISRKIAEEGIEAGHQLSDSISDLRLEWEKQFNEAITQDIEGGLDALFSEFFVTDRN